MDYLLLGKIIKPHGLKGEVKIFSNTDFASLRYQKDSVVFYFDSNEYKPLTVEYYSKSGKFDIVKFKEFNDINSINSILNKNVYVNKIEAKLPKNYYHYSDLVDSLILDENNIKIGKVIGVIEYPANICLKCFHNESKKNFEIPLIKNLF